MLGAKTLGLLNRVFLVQLQYSFQGKTMGEKKEIEYNL
jgi:hypothetical protein